MQEAGRGEDKAALTVWVCEAFLALNHAHVGRQHTQVILAWVVDSLWVKQVVRVHCKQDPLAVGHQRGYVTHKRAPGFLHKDFVHACHLSNVYHVDWIAHIIGDSSNKLNICAITHHEHARPRLGIDFDNIRIVFQALFLGGRVRSRWALAVVKGSFNLDREKSSEYFQTSCIPGSC
jgi:hypothetical protein